MTDPDDSTLFEAPEPLWVSRAVVVVIHARVVGTHGGQRGVLDGGLVESAIARPRNRRAYDSGVDVADLAASYCAGLARNHGFIDGNKRTAFQTMFVFLDMNGLELVADETEVVPLMLDVATGVVDEKVLAEWVREHVVSNAPQ